MSTVLIPMMKKSAGFTLIELMITVTIFAILLGVALPSFTNMMDNRKMVSQLSKLTAVIAYGRSEAVTRSVSVIICSSSDGSSCAGNNNWEQGWIMFADVDGDGAADANSADCAIGQDCMLNVQDRLPDGVTLRGSVANLVYTATGDPAAGGGTTFRLCSANAESSGDTQHSRTITINAPGSASVAMGAATCP